MGVDFIRKAAKSFEKCWDRNRSELAAPNLFAGDPNIAERRFLARPITDLVFEQGMELVGELDGHQLRVFHGAQIVATVPELPMPVLNRLRNQGAGTAIVKVEEVHAMSGVAEVTLR